MATQTQNFFFYGTLCHPAILIRVLGHKCEGFTFQDALLPNYTRHRVKDEDYPAVIGREQLDELLTRGKVFTSEEYNTRGTFVRGLSYSDVQAMDIFEGKQYSRIRLPVQTLTSPKPPNHLPDSLVQPEKRQPLDNLEAERLVNRLRSGKPDLREEEIAKAKERQGTGRLGEMVDYAGRVVEAWTGSASEGAESDENHEPEGERRHPGKKDTQEHTFARRQEREDEEIFMQDGHKDQAEESAKQAAQPYQAQGDLSRDPGKQAKVDAENAKIDAENAGNDTLEGIDEGKADGQTSSSSDETEDGEYVKVMVEDPPAVPDGVQEVEILEIGIKEAWVYVWTDDLNLIEPEVWSFNRFLQEHSHRWTGLDPTEYAEVDRARLLAKMPAHSHDRVQDDPQGDGDETKLVGEAVEGFPEFGKGMLKYWNFKEGLVNLNHGSYGSPPRPVVEAMRKISDQIESFPDIYMRRSWLAPLNKVREQVAGMIGADRREVVIVPNATHAINTIVREIGWADGDIIVMYLTTYGAVAQTMKHICDHNPGVSIITIDITFPCQLADVVEATEKVFAEHNHLAKPHFSGTTKPVGVTERRVRMCVVDQIASNPGVIYPWEEIVSLCKKYGVLSLVDAAHAIGQVKTDVKKSDPDFWISNCHKWLLAHRGCAIMYIPVRNQAIVRSSFPTSAGYESSRYPSPGGRKWNFEKQYEWTGTQDWSPFMSITPAIEFRESIGGEQRIMEYCHSLAVQGGKRLCKKWGTAVMDNPEHDLTAAMVNVALPDVPAPKDLDEQFKQLKFFEDGLFEANCFAAAYRHDGRWWGRFSAQVWNELSDFDYVGDVFAKLCERIRRGEHLDVQVSTAETVHEAEDMPTHDE